MHGDVGDTGGDAEEDIEDPPVIIIDNGSGTCKAGMSTHEEPTHVFAEVVGMPRRSTKASMAKEYYFGDDALCHRNGLCVSYPLENGIIENFDHMERLWEYTITDQLKVSAEEHPVLLTEPPYNPKPNRERMVEIMFEKFCVPSLNISIQGVLALLGQGRTTGVVLDSGEGVTHTIPIFDGFGMPYCINRLDLAGRELNVLLAKLMAQEGVSLTTTEEQHQTRLIKEKHCYVALEPTSEFCESVAYKLPDGRELTICEERWKCPEALFTPQLCGLEAIGVAGMVWESISRCEIDLRKQLLSNVVLSGGSTMFPGFRERMMKELRSFAPSTTQGNIRIVNSKDQKFAVWTGAQVSANLRSMQEDQWLTYEDYEEYGASYIHEKISLRYN
eukprot:TRINITY_DN64241_c0_g1_i1.p1 TRINITY_DN64241_c0_g1~~TRINITY_DN64241_c0_g1_i1.p1  ORF type:complete len:388 (+),score=73.48 TRINITY_DN64241_c0_g1_i1:107-1270(+)